MKILVLASKHVRELLTYRECGDVMREALAGLARGQIQQRCGPSSGHGMRSASWA